MDDQKDDMYLLHLNHPEQQPEIQQLSIQLKHRYGVEMCIRDRNQTARNRFFDTTQA